MNLPSWIDQALRQSRISAAEALTVLASHNSDWEILFVRFGCDYRRARLLIDFKGERLISIEDAAAEYYTIKRPAPKAPHRPKVKVRRNPKPIRYPAPPTESKESIAASAQRMLQNVLEFEKNGKPVPRPKSPAQRMRIIYTPMGGKAR